MITVPTKDIGEVKDVFRPSAAVCQRHMNEQDYIKKEMGIDETSK